MVCPSCGTDNVDNFKFCPECGQRLAAATSPAAPAGPPAPAPPPAARVDETAQAARLLEQAFDRYDEGKYDEALGCCQAAIALDPGGSTAHSLLGMIYERMGKTAEAVQQYQFVLRMNPDSIADAIKLESLLGGPKGTGRRGLAGALGSWRRMPVVAGALATAAALAIGVGAISRAVDRGPGSAGRIARSSHGPGPGASMPRSLEPPVGMPGAAASAAPSGGAAPAGTGPVAALPAPPPLNAWPGLRGASPPATRAARTGPPDLAAPAAGHPGPRGGRREARSGYLAPAPVLRVETIDPRQAAPRGDVPGAALPASAGALPRSSRGSAPVLPWVTDGDEPRSAASGYPAAPAALPAASTVPAPPPSASITIEPLDDSKPAPPARSAPPERPATLREALQHEQMAAYYRRQGDDQAAYSEYQYARDLFRKVQQRGGQEGAVAAQGAAAAQYGMARLQAP